MILTRYEVLVNGEWLGFCKALGYILITGDDFDKIAILSNNANFKQPDYRHRKMRNSIAWFKPYGLETLQDGLTAIREVVESKGYEWRAITRSVDNCKVGYEDDVQIVELLA